MLLFSVFRFVEIILSKPISGNFYPFFQNYTHTQYKCPIHGNFHGFFHLSTLHQIDLEIFKTRSNALECHYIKSRSNEPECNEKLDEIAIFAVVPSTILCPIIDKNNTHLLEMHFCSLSMCLVCIVCLYVHELFLRISPNGAQCRLTSQTSLSSYHSFTSSIHIFTLNEFHSYHRLDK